MLAQIAYQNSLDQYKIQLGLPPDLPMVLDRGLTKGFRDVFERIDEWFTDEDREPSELPGYVAQLPELPDVIIDGRPVVALGIKPDQREDVLLAAERLALENRYELMNQRAQLYDAWRSARRPGQCPQGRLQHRRHESDLQAPAPRPTPLPSPTRPSSST